MALFKPKIEHFFSQKSNNFFQKNRELFDEKVPILFFKKFGMIRFHELRLNFQLRNFEAFHQQNCSNFTQKNWENSELMILELHFPEGKCDFQTWRIFLKILNFWSHIILH